MGMNIFEYYGIKEVANVYFEALTDDTKLGSNIKAGDIVLYLDTLKVSTVETTAENVSAQGGWGNPKLITWDYGKDINVTLEDAVVTFEELRIMLGAKLKESANEAVTVHMSAEFEVVEEEGEGTGVKAKTLRCLKTDKDGKVLTNPDVAVKYIDRKNGLRGQAANIAALFTAEVKDNEGKVTTPAGAFANHELGARVMLFWEEVRSGAEGNQAVELVISPSTFPGTYKVVGDALIRNEKGEDEAFQFVIKKAKMLSEVTLTMQAEGDPSTFNMTLNVLRDPDGNMMSLIKY